MIVEMPLDAWESVMEALPEGWARERIAGFINGRNDSPDWWVQLVFSQPDGRSSTHTFVDMDYDTARTFFDKADEAMGAYRRKQLAGVASDKEEWT